METIIKAKIERLTNELYNLAADKEGRSIRAIIRPRKNGVDKKKKYLDALARLLTGKETCAAVYWDGKKLLIASNDERPRYAEDYLEKLRYFVNNPSSKGNIKNLVWIALKEIYSIIISKSALRRPKNIWQVLKKKMQTLDNFINFVKKTVEEGKGNYDKEELENLVRELFREIKEMELNNNHLSANEIWEYLLPFYDTITIINAICEEKIEKQLVESLKKVKSVEFIKGQKNVHAEMKIIEKMIERLNQGEELGSLHYIGINKLTCAPCQLAINAVNESRDNQLFRVYGTHGGTYMNWLAPENFPLPEKENLYKMLEKTKKNQLKSREISSEIPVEITSLLGNLTAPPSSTLSLISEEEDEWNYLIASTKETVGEELKFALETLLDAQEELTKINNNTFAHKQLERAKKELKKKLSENEIEQICSKKEKITKLQIQLEAQIEVPPK